MAQERYEQRGKPKSGTFGDVYKVWDTTLEVERAFKRVRVKDDAERQSVIREARLLVKLGSHTNIVQLYDIIEGDTYVGLVMDWIEGETLSEYLGRKGTLAKSEALQIIGEVLKALEFAHAQNVLHSDIKPGNVMRGTDGSIRLVDFGVARTLGTHSMGTAMGVTYPYAPPEFFQPPHKLDLRADLWATGVMLYQLVTGKQPFTVEQTQSNNPFAWAGAITPCQYTAPPDKDIATLLDRVLVPLNQRLSTAEDFHNELRFSVPRFIFYMSSNRKTPMLDEYKSLFVRIPDGMKKYKDTTVYKEWIGEDLLRQAEMVFLGEVNDFYIARTPVVVGMWQEYCFLKGKEMPPLPNYMAWREGWDAVLYHPIVNVSWYDAKEYAEWADLELPTEAMWEYAARSGDWLEYPWGNEWKSSECQCSKKMWADSGGTATVGSFSVGPFGLYDMAGNVWEWCADWYDRDRKNRSLRGGSWANFYASDFRSMVRNWSAPTSKESYVGFRLASSKLGRL